MKLGPCTAVRSILHVRHAPLLVAFQALRIFRETKIDLYSASLFRPTPPSVPSRRYGRYVCISGG